MNFRRRQFLSKSGLILLGGIVPSLLIPRKSYAGLNFDGTNAYINIPDDNRLDFGSSSFSYGGWLFSIGTGTQHVVCKQTGDLNSTSAGFTFGVSSAAGTGFSANVSNGTTSCRTNSGSHAARGGSYWFHFMIVVDKTVNYQRMYLAGSYIAQTALWTTGNADNALAMRISGRTDDTTRRYQGRAAFLAFWNSIIAANEIRDIANSGLGLYSMQVQPSNLRAFYPLDEGVENAVVSTVFDRVAQSHGTTSGSPVGRNEMSLSRF